MARLAQFQIGRLLKVLSSAKSGVHSTLVAIDKMAPTLCFETNELQAFDRRQACSHSHNRRELALAR